jgi:hypothetical protein
VGPYLNKKKLGLVACVPVRLATQEAIGRRIILQSYPERGWGMWAKT